MSAEDYENKLVSVNNKHKSSLKYIESLKSQLTVRDELLDHLKIKINKQNETIVLLNTHNTNLNEQTLI